MATIDLETSNLGWSHLGISMLFFPMICGPRWAPRAGTHGKDAKGRFPSHNILFFIFENSHLKGDTLALKARKQHSLVGLKVLVLVSEIILGDVKERNATHCQWR